MKETSISQTNSENVKADEKDLSLQDLTDQILPKRIRKRIKYTRKVAAEMPEIITVAQLDQKPL